MDDVKDNSPLITDDNKSEEIIYIPREAPALHKWEEVRDLYYVYIKDQHDRDKIKQAYEFVLQHHQGQKRKSGEPYIHHLIEVAYILAKLQAGPATIIGGLLHDVVEDTEVEVSDIRHMFGSDVARLVDAVTKIQRLKLSKRSETDFVYEDHRKIFLGMAKDIRVIIIKLADRLHNLRTLSWLSRERQIAISKETLEVFVPIAHRLGIYNVKSEMEDLCLKYLEYPKYQEIMQMIEQRTKNRQKSLDDLKKRIADIIFENKIPFRLESRIKSIYSIYKKMYLKDHAFDEIFDIMAIRIITKTELNCYEILGIIHATYKPLPGRFKDYIAMPKPNMYQSLHTTIMSGDGQAYEVQIRTEAMDEIAEGGVAAHWRYKEGTNYDPRIEQREIEEKLHWFRDFVGVSENLSDDAKEYMDTLTRDIFDANVYVFTPKGKVVELPTGATPLDFAYKIHTGVGDSAVGALVNNALVPLNTVLKTGDIVEIKTSKTSNGPNEGWLNIAVTQSARAHIRKALQKKNSELMRSDHITRGKQSCIDAFHDRGIEEEEMLSLINSNKVFNEFHVNNLDDLFVAISNRNPVPGAIIDFLNIKAKPKVLPVRGLSAKATDHTPVHVQGAGKVAINLGNCCTPIPGDDIVGYITKGKGITVHRVSCPNIAKAGQRLIDVYWNEDLGIQNYPVDIAVICDDRPGLLVEIMGVLSAQKIPISQINAKLHIPTMTATISATIQVSDAHRLHDIFVVIKQISDVRDVVRVFH
ncbi:MAG: bifunctional (p)ppGpp synthetase/guanosine-3',5'-bis(diphosphate) 3'-pyrophosphohydrolase [Bacilli bacterium]|nr:bifunctional (p)ppGpp synthetase/guanosine-3',5'-bis(diphosphate) 3'-pyrophosphohydrolase [Bacilli bacterium]MDD4520507.1 bifunctional (p)ppGpp synthetase/guanosine-3',5'-bis(diphosphate) 3'-pyrophosphohydrolase [Bacilli bacterium]